MNVAKIIGENMQICEAIQERWNNIVSEVPLLSSILSSDGKNELFKKSFGLVWNHFKKVMAEDQNKSTLLMLAPPYRKMELLECVLKVLVEEEKISSNFLTPEEIKSAWKNKTQVMLCFNCKGKLNRIAYTPQEGDIDEGIFYYRYGTSGRCSLNLETDIVLKAENRRNNGKISGKNRLCVRDRDEELFGEEGFLTLKRAIVIVGNKNNETVELLKKMTIGRMNLWDAFSAVELGPNGSCINGAKGNGTPSIIVANDFERIRKYLKSVGGRYKQYYCVMCDDGYEFRANGTWGMGEQIAIRSSETIIKKLFKVDNPVEFKKYYELVAKNGCLFVWDRYFDRALRGEENLGKNVTVIKRETMEETWSCLYDKIKSLKKSEMELQDAYRTICTVYRHLHLPKIDVQICREALESIETDDKSVCEVKTHLEELLDYFDKNETEKMVALKQYLCRVAKPYWTVGVLSNREDYSCLSISKYAQAIPRIVKRVSRPEENPVVTTIAYKKMSTPVANRHWLFKNPNTKIQWFLYEDEVNALNALSDLLDDLETRHVMSRHDRANVLGVEEDLLYESVHATKNITKKDPSSEDVLKDISIQKILPESNQESLEDAMTRYFYHDVAARIHDNNKEISLGKSEIVIVKFGDNTHARYTKSKKALVLEGDVRKAIDAGDLKPGQRIFEILPEKVKCRKKKVYGSLDDARKRWRMVLQRMLANHHLDSLACAISTEAQKFGLDKVFTSKRLQLYGAESYRTRLPYNKMSRAVPLFRAIGVVGNDEELANERYAWGLAEFIQDANTENRVSGRKYMEMLRNEWLSGSSEIEECFVEKTVQESYEIDSDDDILTEE